MQPVLTTVTDTVGSLSNDVVAGIAPVEAAVQPVLTTVTDTVGSLSNDVVAGIAPVGRTLRRRWSTPPTCAAMPMQPASEAARMRRRYIGSRRQPLTRRAGTRHRAAC